MYPPEVERRIRRIESNMADLLARLSELTVVVNRLVDHLLMVPTAPFVVPIPGPLESVVAEEKEGEGK